MIDVYAPAGTFRDRSRMARDLATAVMTIERVPNIPLFRQNTAAFVHDLPLDALSNVDGDHACVRVQVLTNAGGLDRAKQLAAVAELTRIVAAAPGDSDANETQLTGWPPACTARSRAARCASSEVPPIASTTGYTSYPSRNASSAGNAMQISVHSAQKTSLCRPVARTARTKSASSQALVLVRSTGGLFASSSASGETVGLPRPDFTLTVECTIGSPNRRASFTVETIFLRSRSRSMDRTAPTCTG